MATEIPGMRAQILANAKIMLKPTRSSPNSYSGSQMTLISNYYGEIDVVVFGNSNNYTAAVMLALTPAIEGEKAATMEGAMRKLLVATAELLNTYIPKVGDHQRNIHGGGVFDEDLISAEIVEARKKSQ